MTKKNHANRTAERSGKQPSSRLSRHTTTSRYCSRSRRRHRAKQCQARANLPTAKLTATFSSAPPHRTGLARYKRAKPPARSLPASQSSMRNTPGSTSRTSHFQLRTSVFGARPLASAEISCLFFLAQCVTDTIRAFSIYLFIQSSAIGGFTACGNVYYRP